ncbi:TetR/AcrR family transcriptional regulator [Winogradskyella bathintestinalis]|uniref:TetR/AcrR family transcriptional regulator n=1 Tax=Winogradskyella bathintestinalis TaxID=3035208 RepID=A0ABT7ZX80_9FLAO|nr:TetR/AcrR family transcriptional regulator [Winogradskyella bathintestinalis]MDN3493603.1 TetR/AcrR family transcriptional regulator [Winogradskyella bathintestinalis]
MPESNETKSKLLRASKTLFWKYGIKRVTVEEISEQAEVSKMTFYRHYKNKEAIAEAVLEQVFNKSMRRYTKIMSSDDDFRVKVDAIVKLQYDDAKGISEEFIVDILKKDNSPLHKKLEELNQNSLQQVKKDFIEAQRKGEIRADLNIDFMMYMLNDLNTKLVDKQLIKYYNTEEALIMELTNFFFYGILP